MESIHPFNNGCEILPFFILAQMLYILNSERWDRHGMIEEWKLYHDFLGGLQYTKVSIHPGAAMCSISHLQSLINAKIIHYIKDKPGTAAILLIILA